MRYLGSKESIADNIVSLLRKKHLHQRNLVFFDAFCGMGAVADSLKSIYNHIIINDTLNCCTVFSRGKLYARECLFDSLGIDPFAFLNENNNTVQGFIYKNYSPGGSERMYFTEDNAGRID